jgi:tetratricopeptide (TPR) repeat protein
MDHMLSEEALIALFGLIACGAIILGALELMWPARPRRPPPGRRVRRSRRPRHAQPPARAPYVRRSPLPMARPVTVTDRQESVPLLPAPAPAAPAAAAAPVTAATSTGPSAVDTCFELYQERRFADVIALGTGTLQADPPPAAHETAALWSVVALARQAAGDQPGAGDALESAIESAPAAERVTYQRQLVSLALNVAQAALSSATNHMDAGSEERVAAIRDAVAWLERAQATTDGEASLDDLRTSAHALLWPAYEQVVMALVQRQDFRAARRHLREALDDPAFPHARADRFRELLSGTFSGEIGQLTAQAIASMQDARESEALGALQRAETLLGSIADEALTPKRREEVDRRLWWGYNKLGTRRLAAGEFEEALEPLLHAARFPGVGPDRQAQTHAALASALTGAADVRALAVRQLADEGDREAAVVASDRLWSLIRAATEAGVTEEQLSTAITKARRLVDSLR